MVAKGIIKEKINNDTVKVYVPSLDITTFELDSNILTASISMCNGCKPNLNVNDIVFVEFEDLTINPVVVGYLMSSNTAINNTYTDATINSLYLTSDASFTSDTAIGESITAQNIQNLENLDRDAQGYFRQINTEIVPQFNSNIIEKNNNIKENMTKLNEHQLTIDSINSRLNNINKNIGVDDFNTVDDLTLFGKSNELTKTYNKLNTLFGKVTKESSVMSNLMNLLSAVESLEDMYNAGYNGAFANNTKYSANNPPLKCIMYDSNFFNNTENRNMQIDGIVIHSTRINNPNLNSYVQPSTLDKNYKSLLVKLGKNKRKTDFNSLGNKAKEGYHAFIGKAADGSVISVQTLPWTYKVSAAGLGKSGSCDDNYIHINICEDSLSSASYFKSIYDEALQLVAYLCLVFNISPTGKVLIDKKNMPVILDHQEAFKYGMAINNGDILHWFKIFNKSMATFRDELSSLIQISTSLNNLNDYGEINCEDWIIQYGEGKDYLTKSQMQNNAACFYNWASKQGWSIPSIAGLLGLMECESNINPACINWSEYKKYPNYGTGLVQWTNTPISTATTGEASKMVSYCTSKYGTWKTGIGQCEYLKKTFEDRSSRCEISQMDIIPADLREKLKGANGFINAAKCTDPRWTCEMAAAFYLCSYTAGVGSKSSQSYYDAHYDSWMSYRRPAANRWYDYILKNAKTLQQSAFTSITSMPLPNTFMSIYNSTEDVTPNDIIAAAKRQLNINEDMCKLICGTTYNEGYWDDPYLLFAWACAMINVWSSYSVESLYTTIAGWDHYYDSYSKTNVLNGYNNLCADTDKGKIARKVTYMAFSARDPRIIEVDGMGGDGTVLYTSKVYTKAKNPTWSSDIRVIINPSISI